MQKEMICDSCKNPSRQLCTKFMKGGKIIFQAQKNGQCFHCRLLHGIGFDFELEEFGRRNNKKAKPRFGKK